jgi:hypothetical protein
MIGGIDTGNTRRIRLRGAFFGLVDQNKNVAPAVAVSDLRQVISNVLGKYKPGAEQTDCQQKTEKPFWGPRSIS